MDGPLLCSFNVSVVGLTFDPHVVFVSYSISNIAMHLCDSAAEQGMHFEPMLIEKWPLIQAFALEGFAGWLI